jgi:hypothetical protein
VSTLLFVLALIFGPIIIGGLSVAILEAACDRIEPENKPKGDTQ